MCAAQNSCCENPNTNGKLIFSYPTALDLVRRGEETFTHISKSCILFPFYALQLSVKQPSLVD